MGRCRLLLLAAGRIWPSTFVLWGELASERLGELWILSVVYPHFVKGSGFVLSYLCKEGIICKAGEETDPGGGRNLNFSAFVFFIEIQNIDDTSYQFLTMKISFLH